MRLIDAVRNAPLFELMVITGGLVNDFRSAPEKKITWFLKHGQRYSHF